MSEMSWGSHIVPEVLAREELSSQMLGRQGGAQSSW